MPSPEPRVATLVLCTPSGRLLGALPPFQVSLPWWQDAESLVAGARARFGVEVTILRLLEASRPSAPGGAVTYLAEVDEAGAGQLSLEKCPEPLAADPLRLPYAEPGGPARDLEWAADRLRDRGIPETGQPVQVRTWNLSSLWRIPTEQGDVWLKCVPPFFAHEGAVLTALQGWQVPELVAHEAGRILMPEIPGDDLYGAPLDTCLLLVSMLVRLQSAWIGREGELFALGLPDWRAEALASSIEDVVRRTAPDLSGSDLQALQDLVDHLPERFEAVRDCGIPDTIVHGDFAPGNARGRGNTLVLLDWGDCGVGHPLLDQSAFVDRISPHDVPRVREHWAAEWRAAIPGCRPARAAPLLAPVAASRQAVIYRVFLDQIESSEHPYHQADPADWLTRTAALTRTA